MSLVLFINNGNVAELSGVKNSVTDVVDTGADVQITILDRGGDPVAGESWPVTLDHVADGLYRATLDAGLVLVSGRHYTAKVEAVGTGGEPGQWECVVRAVVRRCC